jgi:predicted kinase
VIGGPIASGKSTLAIAVARAFECRGLVAATIDLDLVYEMLEHARAPKNDAVLWTRARRTAGALTKALLADGVDVVIAEGDFIDDPSRQELVSAFAEDVRIQLVTLRVDLLTALSRVDQDSTRGISRDPGFLTRHYEEVAETLRVRPAQDLCLDTGALTVKQATEAIVALLGHV